MLDVTDVTDVQRQRVQRVNVLLSHRPGAPPLPLLLELAGLPSRFWQHLGPPARLPLHLPKPNVGMFWDDPGNKFVFHL